MMPMPTQERLRELLDYDKETGVFRWKVARGGMAQAGAIAGKTGKNGYQYIRIDYKFWLSHRLAWVYVHGVEPAGEIDHIDGNSLNNAIANLRDVPPCINKQNVRESSPKRRNGRLLGAFKSAGGRWRAQIALDGKKKHLGCFATEEEAHEAYLAEKRQIHVGCTI